MLCASRIVSVVLAVWGLTACSNDPNRGTDTDAATTDASDLTESSTDANDASVFSLFTPTAEPGRHLVSIGETRKVVPGDGLPSQTPAMQSNNNLDVIRFQDRVYLAWRSAPNHFASTETKMFIVSSADEITWRFESQIALNTDVREPRFLVVAGTLFLYFAELGTDPLGFTPHGTWMTARTADTVWSAPSKLTLGTATLSAQTFIPWRGRTENVRPMGASGTSTATPFLVAYDNGQNIYLFNNLPMNIHLFTTTNGTDFTDFGGTGPVSTGGGSETDFTLGDDGRLFAVTRNEAGDSQYGWGSKICTAPANDLHRWTCRPDPKKYDSPLMFWYDGEAYLIGRRNITPTGNYDLMDPDTNVTRKTIAYQTAYSRAAKRCALWRFDQTRTRIAFMTDLPSAGDTCFASVLTTNTPGRFVIYNYSSDINTTQISWMDGQRGPTYIYRTELTFTPNTIRDN